MSTSSILSRPSPLDQALHVIWDLVPYALDRAIAGELAWGQVLDWVRYARQVEAHEVETWSPDDAPFVVIEEMYVRRDIRDLEHR